MSLPGVDTCTGFAHVSRLSDERIDKEKIGPMQETLEHHKINIDGLYETIEKYLIPMVADVKHLKEELALLKGTEGGNKRQKTGDDAEQS